MKRSVAHPLLLCVLISWSMASGDLYHTDFEDGNLSDWAIEKAGYYPETVSWNLVADTSQAWEATGGYWVGGGTSYAYLPGLDVADVVVEAQVKPVTILNGGHQSGVLARYTDAAHFYAFHFTTSGTYVALAKSGGGVATWSR